MSLSECIVVFRHVKLTKVNVSYRWGADRSFLLTKKDGASPISAYLDMDQIIDIAKSANVDAIHPGYVRNVSNLVSLSCVTHTFFTHYRDFCPRVHNLHKRVKRLALPLLGRQLKISIPLVIRHLRVMQLLRQVCQWYQEVMELCETQKRCWSASKRLDCQ